MHAHVYLLSHHLCTQCAAVGLTSFQPGLDRARISPSDGAHLLCDRNPGARRRQVGWLGQPKNQVKVTVFSRHPEP